MQSMESDRAPEVAVDSLSFEEALERL